MKNSIPIYLVLTLFLVVISCSSRKGNSKKIYNDLNCERAIRIVIDQTNPTQFVSLKETTSNRRLTDDEIQELKMLFEQTIKEVSTTSLIDISIVDQLGFPDKNVSKAYVRLVTVVGKNKDYERDANIEFQYKMLGDKYDNFVTNISRKNPTGNAIIKEYAMKIAVKELVMALCNEMD